MSNIQYILKSTKKTSKFFQKCPILVYLNVSLQSFRPLHFLYSSYYSVTRTLMNHNDFQKYIKNLSYWSKVPSHLSHNYFAHPIAHTIANCHANIYSHNFTWLLCASWTCNRDVSLLYSTYFYIIMKVWFSINVFCTMSTHISK